VTAWTAPGPARVWLPAAVAAATLATFTPALWNEFLDYDDYAITSNPAYQGLGLRELRWMFTTVTTGHYMPITWLSLALDYVMWGLNPVGFHLTNLLIHAASGLIFYLIALRLYRHATTFPAGVLRLAAVAAALFFALHPLRVAVVAWVSARNDLLANFFALAAVLLYLEARTPGRARRWLLGASATAYLFALASKAIVLTLPLVLVLLDIYPLRRWRAPRESRALWLEKVPFVALSLLGAAIAYYPHRPVTLSGEYPWPARVAVTMHSLWFYVRKTVLPQELSPIYELPSAIDPWAPEFLAAAVGVVALTAVALASWRRWPSGLAVWVYYGITLAPVSGVVFTGWLAADRYGYLACLGFALLLGSGAGVVADAWARGRLGPWRAGTGISAMAGLVGLALLSAQQVRVWRDSESLWRYAVEATPQCFICQTNRGLWLLAHGSPLSGLGHLQRARAVRPDRLEAHVNLGLAFTRLGMLPEAVETYQVALGRFPDTVGVRALLAQALLEAGRPRESIDHFRQAIGREPAAANARLGLVRAHLAVGETDVAGLEYEALRRLDPILAREVAAAFPSRP
jgi:hypothetical protein